MTSLRSVHHQFLGNTTTDHAGATDTIPFNDRHPGSVAGQIAIMGTMPGLLEYVGGGFNRFGLPAWLGGASHGNGLDREPRSQVPGVSAPKRDLKAEDFEMKGIPGLAK